MPRKIPRKPYWKMNLRELQEATKEFDKPIDLARTRPLSPAQRVRFERARHGPTVSIYVYGDKTRMIKMRVNSELLKAFDKCAIRLQLKRDKLIERCMVATLQFLR